MTEPLAARAPAPLFVAYADRAPGDRVSAADVRRRVAAMLAVVDAAGDPALSAAVRELWPEWTP